MRIRVTKRIEIDFVCKGCGDQFKIAFDPPPKEPQIGDGGFELITHACGVSVSAYRLLLNHFGVEVADKFD